ncbi:hypothetical protein [Lacimicrobium alkaliphilum]|uniref:Uncharacterized protein n=1 Tax=Lacimicrobium alkaliphilum TaxID=1526571 RepID=A0A0U3AMN1_9ALTE|nr:hypothetical protein [Lacimicrobium alkaliphilum]ALT00050.1 hypothetical protein AT746_18425 [Lacimicrobium alkaliphilum]
MNANIQRFLELARVHPTTDYGNSTSVNAGNQAADSMRELALKFVESGRADDLLSLLSDRYAAPWVAYNLAEITQIPEEQKRHCISFIQHIADGSNIESVGAEIWLRERGYGDS